MGDFTVPPASVNGPIAESRWVPDECINPHPRFGTLTNNIRQRRGSNVDIRVPLFVDRNTFTFFSRRHKKVREIKEAPVPGPDPDCEECVKEADSSGDDDCTHTKSPAVCSDVEELRREALLSALNDR